jgi:hypothetical protein
VKKISETVKITFEPVFTSNEIILVVAFVILREALGDTLWFIALCLTLKSYAYSYIMGISITITLSYTELHREVTELHRVNKSDLCGSL